MDENVFFKLDWAHREASHSVLFTKH